MTNMLRSVRRACLEVGRRTGSLTRVGNSDWRRHRLLILCYHGISLDDEHLWDGSLYMPPTLLAERLRRLAAADCHVLPLAQALERLQAGTLPPRSVALTFDDGYHDFVEQAFPLLAEHGYPATVYLPTLHCGRNAPVFAPACSYILWKARGRQITVPEVRREPLDLRTPAGRDEAVAAVKRCAKRRALTLADKNLLLQQLASAAGIDYAAIQDRRVLQIMSPADVTRLSGMAVDFELHTHRHRTPADRASFVEEIEINIARLEAMTGKVPRHFCYPSGAYEPEFLPWLTELGVTSATTCDPGLATRHTPPLMLPRLVDTSMTSAIEFEGWLTGAASLLTPRRSYAHAAASA